MDLEYNQKFGSLFQEFSCNQNILQTAYYSIFTSWNLVYSINQLYFIKSEYAQRGLNLVLSIFMIIYLVKFKPFRQKGILLSNMVSGTFNFLLFLIIFFRSFIEFFKQDDYFDFLFIGAVSSQILFHYVVIFIYLIIKIKKFYSIYLKRNESTTKTNIGSII